MCEIKFKISKVYRRLNQYWDQTSRVRVKRSFSTTQNLSNPGSESTLEVGTKIRVEGIEPLPLT